MRCLEPAKQGLQIGANLRGVLEAQNPVFLQAPGNDTFQFLRYLGVETTRRDRRAIQNGIENEGGSIPSER